MEEPGDQRPRPGDSREGPGHQKVEQEPGHWTLRGRPEVGGRRWGGAGCPAWGRARGAGARSLMQTPPERMKVGEAVVLGSGKGGESAGAPHAPGGAPAARPREGCVRRPRCSTAAPCPFSSPCLFPLLLSLRQVRSSLGTNSLSAMAAFAATAVLLMDFGVTNWVCCQTHRSGDTWENKRAMPWRWGEAGVCSPRRPRALALAEPARPNRSHVPTPRMGSGGTGWSEGGAQGVPPTGYVTLGKLFSLWQSIEGPFLHSGPPSSLLNSWLVLTVHFWPPGCGQGLPGRAYHLHHPGVLHCGHCHPLRVPSHPRPSQRGEYFHPGAHPRLGPLRKPLAWKAPFLPLSSCLWEAICKDRAQ